jgi:hypothetical protein
VLAMTAAPPSASRRHLSLSSSQGSALSLWSSNDVTVEVFGASDPVLMFIKIKSVYVCVFVCEREREKVLMVVCRANNLYWRLCAFYSVPCSLFYNHTVSICELCGCQYVSGGCGLWFFSVCFCGSAFSLREIRDSYCNS